MSEYQEPPRPPRSLRDRLGARKVENTELPPSDYIEKKVVETTTNYSDGKDYLSEIDQESDETNHSSLSDEEDDPIPTLQEINKPKVQILNVRDNRKEKKKSEKLEKISTEHIKQEAKKQLQENTNKVKEEFKEIEESFEDTKEEINKIKDKVSEEMQVVKAKILVFGVQALEKLLSVPKSLLMGMIFSRKKRPIEEKNEDIITNNQTKEQQNKIPKIKYGDLLSKNIDFLTYDKKRFVDVYDTGTLLEEIFMSNVISDIKYCVRYVGDLPSVTQGIYSGRKISEIFENITSEDINRFLYYVSLNTETFRRNKYKFSEAFATWILRKSHEL